MPSWPWRPSCRSGAQAFCAIRSYLATAAKQGISMLDALGRAASGAVWVPEHPDDDVSPTYPVQTEKPCVAR